MVGMEYEYSIRTRWAICVGHIEVKSIDKISVCIIGHIIRSVHTKFDQKIKNRYVTIIMTKCVVVICIKIKINYFFDDDSDDYSKIQKNICYLCRSRIAFWMIF